MKYLSQASCYRMVPYLFPKPSVDQLKKKKKVGLPFFSELDLQKKVYLHSMWVSSGITAMFRTQLLNKYILRCK